MWQSVTVLKVEQRNICLSIQHKRISFRESVLKCFYCSLHCGSIVYKFSSQITIQLVPEMFLLLVPLPVLSDETVISSPNI